MNWLSIHRSFTLATLLGTPLVGLAQISQQPLLTRSTAAQPNLVFIYDDSGSMDENFIYQYGGTPGGLGMTGPTPGNTTSWAFRSPDVNRIYYDPRIRYKVRLRFDGTPVSDPTANSSTSFNVYFYKKTAASTQASVWTNQPGDNNPANSNSTSYFSTGTPLGYTPSASELASGATIVRYPNTASNSTASYPKWANRSDCAGNVCTWAEERKNYAIWRDHHSTRDRLAKTGIGLAFQTVGPTIRIGWGRINTLDNTPGASVNNLDAGVSLFDNTRKEAFYSWLYGINISGSTPNRLAVNNVGRYFSRTDSDGPWGTNPNFSSRTVVLPASIVSTEPTNKHYACRRSFAMLMTDGYYNDSFSGLGNIDGNDGPIITNSKGDTYQYKKAGTVNDRDTSSNSFADITQRYWMTDLRPDLDNAVPATTSNESFWQNMSFYAIGLGVRGTMAQSTTEVNQLKAGTLLWPTPTVNDPRAIDDMWHATLNGRGSILTATDSDTLNASIDTMMAEINKLTSSQSGVAVSTASLRTGTRKYTPEYTTGVWKGNVIARTLDPDTGIETGTAWQVQDKDANGITYNGIPAFASRNILVGTTNTSGSKAVPFTLTDMTTAGLINDMPAAARTTQMINYLRGDRSNEGEGTTNFRIRENLLGDIVNSAPVFIKGMPQREQVDPTNAASSYVMEVATSTNPLPGTGSAYTSYKNNLIARPEGSIVVGANDGMLHVFRDGTVSVPTDGGKEIFAYVPRTVLPNVHKLADKGYAHQYFVDGPNVEADAYLTAGWRQLVIGTTGAGGKGVYALDMTDPITLNASKVLWEVNPNLTPYANLGYVLADVQVGALANNSWAAIFGNGYESASGIASLFVVNVETGALIRELQTPSALGGPWDATLGAVTTTYKNGLSGVRLVRDSNEQRVVGAYAGDLRGNLWRFDLSDVNPANWSVTRIFQTGTVTPSTAAPTGYPKPITTIPQTVVHPNGGRVVVIGTGKFYEDSDIPAPYSTQSLYGLRDTVNFGSNIPSGTFPLDETKLVVRTLSYIPSTTELQLTNPDGTVPGYISWATSQGWKIDLPFSGQRLVYPIEKLGSRNSRVLSFGTISPANVSVDVCTQAGSGSGWDFFVDGLYGGDPGRAPDVPSASWNTVLATTSGAFSLGQQTRADGRNTTVLIESRSNDTQKTFATLGGGSSGSLISTFNCIVLGNCKPSTPPSTKTIKNREWRQIYLR